jgi:predicted outer membrane protein
LEKEDLVRKVDIFKLDKTYLEKEILTMNDRCRALEEKLAQRSSELEAAKETQLNQFQHILETTEKQRAEYETKLQV